MMDGDDSSRGRNRLTDVDPPKGEEDEYDEEEEEEEEES